MMDPSTLMETVADQSHRANPYPLYAQLSQPVTLQTDGSYVVSGYHEILALLHDPRFSNDPDQMADTPPGTVPLRPFFLTDPPEHDRLRRVTMRHFGPPERPHLIADMEGAIGQRIDTQIAGLSVPTVDIVVDFAHPLPLATICELLGVPTEDIRQVSAWSDDIIEATNHEVTGAEAEELARKLEEAERSLVSYFKALIDRYRADPRDCALSNMANDAGSDAMTDDEMGVTAFSLLIAGHETSVDLISAGYLLLLRHPHVLERLTREPELAIPLVEEVLRLEPPFQYLPPNTVVTDVEVAGIRIPKGSRITLLVAAANRDPRMFPDPDRFDPDREDIRHLSLSGGIHYCFGAPLARIQAQLALTALAQHLENPRLAEDPPPYRSNPASRGMRRLLVDVDGVAL